MATLAPDSPPVSPPFNRKRKSWGRRLERCCCGTLAYFPLGFVYGLTTWAAWVEITLGFRSGAGRWSGPATSALGLVLYALANISYTTAVFTDPGSPLNQPSQTSFQTAGYSSLPTQEPENGSTVTYTSLTAKSTGRPRFCKKCQCVKPDRAHHCSTCKRCVLKMDHHCPWLATCVGLRNYKAFLLFLIYTSIFCWLCFAVSAQWVWRGILDETRLEESAMIVNTILLAVLGGIIGLVLSGFTGWHIYLALHGQTTIEALEKTRYLSPLKKSMENQLQRGRHYIGEGHGDGQENVPFVDQLKEIHANALPSVTRPEEGEERTSNNSTPSLNPACNSPAQDSLRRTYADMEEQRERERYAAYLDEQDSEKLPHAFDLGWRQNLAHLLGENRMLWPLPVSTTTGDGWRWDVSQQWITERDHVAQRRLQRQKAEQQSWSEGANNGFGMPNAPNGAGRYYGGPPLVSQAGRWSDSGNRPPQPVPMQNLDARQPAVTDGSEGYESSSDEDVRRGPLRRDEQTRPENWNDIPDDFLSTGRAGPRSRSRGRQKGD